MQDARRLNIHLGRFNGVLELDQRINDRQLADVIAKLKQLGENNSVSVLRPGERENGFYGGTGIDSLDEERYNTFLAQANQLIDSYSFGRTMRVKDETVLKPMHRGSVLMGILGAIGGGLVGAVVFGLVAYFGFFISYLGFIIAWAAGYGYDLLGGQQGKMKRIVLIIVIFFSVFMGFMFAHSATFSRALDGNLLAGFQMAWHYFRQQPLWFFNVNFLIGLAFAYLGAMNILRQRY